MHNYVVLKKTAFILFILAFSALTVRAQRKILFAYATDKRARTIYITPVLSLDSIKVPKPINYTKKQFAYYLMAKLPETWGIVGDTFSLVQTNDENRYFTKIDEAQVTRKRIIEIYTGRMWSVVDVIWPD